MGNTFCKLFSGRKAIGWPKLFVVPNGTLLSQNLLNWTLTEKTRRLEVNVDRLGASALRVVVSAHQNIPKFPNLFRCFVPKTSRGEAET